ncbi:hypothetical protein [Luteipulveratus flavus]|uniref:HTH HARE-type domain-containing protein n=1 Tax=Luteipulveratus flavus TaxID=3031728 RepID=A0ABT6C6J0_9MICO|nr:hypothetical protein [Luteipulveratus sp. YIM 133296]MDF8264336.1 hypothetical protein [Luteipulveratus sp. YIM 133296]
MSKADDMQGLFKKAAEIASVVPPSMQEAAFHRALDLLTGTGSSNAGPAVVKPENPDGRRVEQEGQPSEDSVDGLARVMAVSRDKATEVDQEKAVLGRSIALLVVASREAGVDGLTAKDLAQILTEKFRHRTTRQAVIMALDNAGNMVDRHKSGTAAAVYRVMRAGEEWLATPVDERSKPTAARTRRRATTKKTIAPTKATGTTPTGAKAKGAPTTAKAASTGRGRKGPKAMLEVLIGEGFFATPRTIGDIRTQLRDQKAMSFEATDLSPGLTRLLREGKLRREKADKQYVYSAV